MLIHILMPKKMTFSLICIKQKNQVRLTEFFKKLNVFKEPLFIPRLFPYYILMLKCPFIYEMMVTVGSVCSVCSLLCLAWLNFNNLTFCISSIRNCSVSWNPRGFRQNRLSLGWFYCSPRSSLPWSRLRDLICHLRESYQPSPRDLGKIIITTAKLYRVLNMYKLLLCYVSDMKYSILSYYPTRQFSRSYLVMERYFQLILSSSEIYALTTTFHYLTAFPRLSF